MSNPAMHNLTVWKRRFNVVFEDPARAQATLDKYFKGSVYVGPLAMVLRKVIAERSAIEDVQAARCVAYYVACGVAAVVRGESTSGASALEIMAKALQDKKQVSEADKLIISRHAMQHSLATVALMAEALTLRSAEKQQAASGTDIARVVIRKARGY